MKSLRDELLAFGIFGALTLQPCVASAATSDFRVLEPAGSWTLDFAEERCSLIREFADGDAKIRIQIDSFGPSFQGYRVMLSGNLVPGSSAAPFAELVIGYSPDNADRDRLTLPVGTFQDENAVSFRGGFLPQSVSAPDRAAGDVSASSPQVQTHHQFEDDIEHVTIAFRLRDALVLDTGNMAGPFAAMRLCVNDLVASWGFDPAQFNALSRRVQIAELASGQQVISPTAEEQYPSRAERRRRDYAQAIQRNGELVPVRLSVNSKGRPNSCIVQVGFATDDYRQAVCDELLQNQYRPALDAEGRPVDSFIQFETR